MLEGNDLYLHSYSQRFEVSLDYVYSDVFLSHTVNVPSYKPRSPRNPKFHSALWNFFS